MKNWKALALALAIAAPVMTGAAIDATAQRRKTTARKSDAPAAPATPAPATGATPAPAKRNARPDDAATRPAAESPAASPSPAAEAPAKKNVEESVEKNGERDAGARPVAPAQSAGGGGGDAARKAAEEARYSFEFKQPKFFVQRFVIEHDAAGRGKITFERQTDDQPLVEPLEISPSAFARILTAWEALRFLDSEESYQAAKQFPHLGTMWLWMRRDGRQRRAEFNWTSNDHVAALAREYRALAEQQFFVFDMALARQYQPSEAIKILNRLESLLGSKQISDPSQLQPLLLDLTTDERIPLIARNHAERLLKKIQKAEK